MKTVTDEEFRANLSEMLDYLSSGGNIIITMPGEKDIVLTGSDFKPEFSGTVSKLKNLREQINTMNQLPLMQTLREMENRHPAFFELRRKALSFEEAMKRTREKHAAIIKKLEDN